jgi:RNA polymerase-binding transcription factor DksA
MDSQELKILTESLKKRLMEIDKELLVIASEDPLVKGDFNVRVDDIGPSQEDAALEAGELDRQQALVTAFEKERKDIINTLEKIESGEYGKS